MQGQAFIIIGTLLITMALPYWNITIGTLGTIIVAFIIIGTLLIIIGTLLILITPHGSAILHFFNVADSYMLPGLGMYAFYTF